MWLLDARANAEKITYPVVWEKVKDADNVIDYDIREEQTIDQSSVFNANNDTTTGMATVIPWVNAPKLIASTSIIWWETEEATLQATAYNSYHYYIDNYDVIQNDLTQFTLSWEIGTAKLVQTANWLKIPATWTYLLELEYSWIPSQINCTDTILINWTTVHTFVGSYSTYWPNNPTESIYLPFSKWDIFSMHTAISRNVSSYYNETHYIYIKFTKF